MLHSVTTQTCGMLILLVLITLHATQKKLNLDTSKAFAVFMYGMFSCLVLDAASVIAIKSMAEIHPLLLEIACKSYIVAQFGVAVLGVNYLYADICGSIGTRRKERILKILIAYYAIGAACQILLPIKYYDNPQTGDIYTYGPSILSTYFFTLAMLLFLLYSLVRYRKVIAPRRLKMLALWLVSWMGSAIFQFMFNEFLIVGLAGALSLVIIYVVVENPDSRVDRYTGVFNPLAYEEFFKETFAKHRNFCLVNMVNHELSERNKIRYDKQLARNVLTFIDRLPGVNAFITPMGTIAFVTDSFEAFEAIKGDIEKRFAETWDDNGLFLSPSWIVLPQNDTVRSYEELMACLQITRDAIENLYETWIIVDEQILKLCKTQFETAKTLAKALERDWIKVFYQPIYSTETKSFSSAEALMRIIDDEGNILPPFEFIKLAEKNGMIHKIGERIFEKVCKFLSTGVVQSYGVHYIEVNLSVVQCGYKDLGERYIRIMDEHGVPASLINLEITESASLKAKMTLLDNMSMLRQKGCTFSLDDFGTGESNLNYIAEMPVDIVKFDREMTTNYFKNRKTKYIMDAAMSMIKGMQLKIVSEGIETQDQVDALSNKVDYIQGYFFSKPLPEDQFVKFVKINHFNMSLG